MKFRHSLQFRHDSRTGFYGVVKKRKYHWKYKGLFGGKPFWPEVPGHEIMLDIQHSLVYPLAVIVTGAEVF